MGARSARDDKMIAASCKRFALIAVCSIAACKSDRPLALAEASASGASQRWSAARIAELYFSTGVSGYVEPCGCTSKPLGGIQRLATVIKRGHENRALIDAGDLFFPPE